MTGEPRMSDGYAARVRDELVSFAETSPDRRGVAAAARTPERGRFRAAVVVGVVLVALVPVAVWAVGNTPVSPAGRSAETNQSATGIYLTTRVDSLKGKIVPASVAGQGVLGVAANGCVTVGGVFLVAPLGSAISRDGRTLHLAGIGAYHIGDKLPALGGVTSEPMKTSDLPDNYKHCGAGTYENVWGASPQ